MEVALIVKTQRKMRRLSQRDLAARMRCTQVAVSLLEQGKAGSIGLAARALIALGSLDQAIKLLERGEL